MTADGNELSETQWTQNATEIQTERSNCCKAQLGKQKKAQYCDWQKARKIDFGWESFPDNIAITLKIF
eukprot:4899522-Amphidinium_carterae.1